jgi:hypothetical protein
MIGHEVPRALTISLGDGSKVEFETKSVSVKVRGGLFIIVGLADR